MLCLLYAVAAGICVLVLPTALPHQGNSAAFSLPLILLSGVVLSYCLTRLYPGAGRWVRRAAPLCFLAGYGYGAVLLQMDLDRRLPDCADADFRTFTLAVESAPEVLGVTERGRNLRFLATASEISGGPACAGLGQPRVRLTWYSAPPLAAGQIWRVEGKLRPGWSYRNPGGFDYERWLLGQGLHGTGYVKSGDLVEGAEPPSFFRLRALLEAWLAGQPLSQQGLVRALLLGDDSGIAADQWQRLRDSGLIHVVVVSGLHVGIVTGAGFWLGLILMRGLPVLTRRIGVRRLAIPFGLLLSGIYVLLTGAAVPARRAWLFSAVLLSGMAGSRRLSLPGVFGLVILVVLVSQPLVVHQQGFWLSFIAVAALLLYFSTRQSGKQFRTAQLITAQLVLCMGLSPALALFQGSIPVTAAFVNLLVVPLISLLVLPGLLAAALLAFWLGQPAALLLWLTDRLLMVTDRIAALAAGVPALQAVPPPGWSVLVPLSATLLMLCSLPRRWLPVIGAAWLIWLAQAPADPERGTFRITA
ncbi:MAG: ComEC/Rec2 family competence protein, partial [Pseudomonadales bacterium]|nr:ComEC/Rec2 family competence protein [Pseudomonadales bacterium]